MNCRILDIGTTDFSQCYQLQKKLHDEVRHNGAHSYIIEGSGSFSCCSTPHPEERSDEGSRKILQPFGPQDEPSEQKNTPRAHIILTEHLPVITIGRSGSKENLLVSEQFLESKKVKLVNTDRGGDVTYHCPGQIVMYPIIRLEGLTKDVHKYLRSLEEAVIDLLHTYKIDSFRISRRTGVWTEKGKIASIGIGVSGWVTFHGMALNVDCDLLPFTWINPCGFNDIKITKMADFIGKIDKEQVKQRLVEIFCAKFNFQASHQRHALV